MSANVFLDSSVLVASIAKEPDWRDVAAAMEAAARCFTSPLAIVETAMGITSLMRVDPDVASRVVNDLLATHRVEVLPIDTAIALRALEAFSRYGKDRHPARLNLGDCFSYACAKEHRLALLYKGNDFAQTDLA